MVLTTAVYEDAVFEPDPEMTRDRIVDELTAMLIAG
jgi:hypothetical protein